MRPITNVNYQIRSTQNTLPAVHARFSAAAKNEFKAATLSVQDQVNLTETPFTDPEEKTRHLLDELAQNFPGVQFEVVKDSDFLNLKQQAAAAGRGKHLLISQSFLSRMGSSEQDFKDCKSVLLSSVLLLSENHADGVFLGEKQALSWNIREKEDKKEKTSLEQMLQNLKDAKTKTKIQSYSNVSFETSTLYRKLAQSGSKALVQSVMSEAYQNMASLRMVACFGEDKERAKAQKAIRSLEKLMMRSRQKIRHLDQETLLKLRKRRAQKKQEEAKVRQIQEELKKKQSLRRRRDRKIISEGEAADREIQRLKSYLSHLNSTQANAAAAAVDATSVADVSGGEGAVSAEQISFSEPVSF